MGPGAGAGAPRAGRRLEPAEDDVAAAVRLLAPGVANTVSRRFRPVSGLIVRSPAISPFVRPRVDSGPQHGQVRADHCGHGTVALAEDPGEAIDDEPGARAREIALLVTAGASNPEIAGQLFLSRKTVGRRVSNALAKLGARNRVELAASLATIGDAPR